MPVSPDHTVLILAPLGQDAPAMAALLQAQGIATRICPDPADCATQVSNGAGALLLTEESLELPHAPALFEALKAQPAWSELPLVILTRGGEHRLTTLLDLAASAAGTFTLLERPMSAATLLRSVQVALRSRCRQYQVRDLLAAQQRQQELLRQSEEFTRRITDVAPCILYIHDLDERRNVWGNREITSVLGYSREQIDALAGKLPESLLHSGDLQVYATHHARRLALPDGEAAEFEYRMRHADGSWVWLNSREMIFRRHPNGRPAQFIGAARDITERKQAELALQVAEKRFRHLCDANIIGIVTADLEKITFTNDEFLRIIGYSREDLPAGGIKWQEFTPKEHLDKDQRALNELRARGACPPFEKEYIHRAGHRVPILIGAALLTEEPLTWICFVLDITERKAFQAELERLVAERTAKLHELVGELEHLSYTITHDMRAPLRALRGFAEAIQEICSDRPNAELAGLVRRMNKGAERMDLLITDALQYTRAVRQELPLAPVDLGSLLRGLLDTYPEFITADIRLQEPILPVMGNEAALTQCFSNLLGNAVKFVRPGESPQVCVWSERRPDSTPSGDRNVPGQWVRIWVEDKGIGISANMRPKLFQMFSRASREYEGTGIGLALVRKVVQRMGGRVGVESEEGRGSRFWVELSPGDVKGAA